MARKWSRRERLDKSYEAYERHFKVAKAKGFVDNAEHLTRKQYSEQYDIMKEILEYKNPDSKSHNVAAALVKQEQKFKNKTQAEKVYNYYKDLGADYVLKTNDEVYIIESGMSKSAFFESMNKRQIIAFRIDMGEDRDSVLADYGY